VDCLLQGFSILLAALDKSQNLRFHGVDALGELSPALLIPLAQPPSRDSTDQGIDREGEEQDNATEPEEYS
jgi:hypothetical protein